MEGRNQSRAPRSSEVALTTRIGEGVGMEPRYHPPAVITGCVVAAWLLTAAILGSTFDGTLALLGEHPRLQNDDGLGAAWIVGRTFVAHVGILIGHGVIGYVCTVSAKSDEFLEKWLEDHLIALWFPRAICWALFGLFPCAFAVKVAM